MNNLEITSKTINTLRMNNRDEYVPRRFVLKVLQDTSQQLIAQKLLDRTLSREVNLYTRIECFEFEKIEVKSCPIVEFRMCKTVMRSKEPLPQLVYSRLGASIKDIVSLDGDFQFTVVDEQQFRRNKKRQHSLANEVYVYLGVDRHLYILDEEILSLDLSVLTTRPQEAENCSSCKEKNCNSKWEAEFICPDKLLDVVYREALQILGVTKQIIPDSNLNGQQGN